MNPEFHANMAAMFAEFAVEQVDKLRYLREGLAKLNGETYTEEDHQALKREAIAHAKVQTARYHEISTGSYP